MMNKLLCTAVVTAGLIATQASGQVYSPSNDDLLNLAFADFGDLISGSVTSVTEVDGEVELRGFMGLGDGFTRLVVQRSSFPDDLTEFSAFEIEVEKISGSADIAQLYIQSGEKFIFQTAADVALSPGGIASFATADLEAADLVQQYGFQIFGPPDASLDEELVLRFRTSPNAFRILSPAEGTFTASAAFTIDVPSVANATAYTFTIADNPGLTDPAVMTDTTESELVLDGSELSDGSWYVQVTATRDSGTLIASNGPLNFAVVTGNGGGSPGCTIADVAEPFGILDLSDIGAFVDSFTAGCD